ncbi:hypothetical protein [Granulicella mallensis]|uniref:DUF2846 domain-containing protein n=1 Tax=Granulicella mallensis TaxID=940614 RepID=A0A7W7ZTR6_9BACT|nr:hypothetical protein [Granulicella mallensis]MBB5065126.1 hypothetical protein [Granulicella mallensis]
MKARPAVSFFILGLALTPAGAQQRGEATPAAMAACGPSSASFDVKSDKSQQPAPQVPPGKVLVYLFENIARAPLSGALVRVGVDGQWVGATLNETYLTFLVDPGIHHLCVRAQGAAPSLAEDGIALRRLNAQPGKTYYFRAQVLRSEGSGITLLDTVDEDQAQFLLQTSARAISHPK